MTLAESVAMVAPYYNAVLIIILFVMFFKLFSHDSRKFAYIKPWKLLFVALVIFLAETVMTALKMLGLIDYPWIIFGFFEMAIITLFIYMLLLQKQFIKTGKKD
ncbi:hypothetical protein JXB27_01785 [Candidatus Woesearchaeota archaeon]|nr:hypothetical protein [Candidatus Woesearchaeota archaeon]